MAKEKKVKAPGSKKGRKILFIILAAVVLIGAGIVLMVTYLPAKLSEISDSMQSVVSTLNSENSDYVAVNDFISANLSAMKTEAQKDTSAEDPKDAYVYEMQAFENINQATGHMLSFYDLTMLKAVDGKFSRHEIRSIRNNLNDSLERMEDMAKHIKAHKDEMTNFTVILSVWEGIRKDYIELIKDYVEAFSKINEVYAKHTLKGIYGNDATRLYANGASAYLNVIYKNFTKTDNGYAPNIAHTASQNFKAFVEGKNEDNIASYYASAICQKNIKAISELYKATDKKIDFEYLIQHNFNVTDLSLSESQLKNVNPSIKFLQSQDLVSTDYVVESAEEEAWKIKK